HLVVALGDDENVLRRSNGREELRGGLRGRCSVDAERLDGVQTLTAEAVAERAQEGGGDHLLGGALRVVTRLRAVDGATAAVLRHADRALACVTSALLLEGLGTRTRHGATSLRGVRALACRGELCDDDLVDQRNVRLDVEERGGQLDGASLLAVGLQN